MPTPYYMVRPEVAGEIAEGTRLSRASFPPKVENLHYRIDSWLGDHLIESFPCFLASEELVNVLKSKAISGFASEPVQVSLGPDFARLTSPGLVLPTWERLLVTGKVDGSDLALDSKGGLLVSPRALQVLRKLCKNLDTVLADNDAARPSA